MADPIEQLWIRPPGSTLVATDAMFADQQTMRALAEGLPGVLTQLRTATAAVSTATLAVPHAGTVQVEIAAAQAEAQIVLDLAEYLSQQLQRAIENYSAAELNNEAVALSVNAVLTFLFGKSLQISKSALGPLGDIVLWLFPWLARGWFDGSDKQIGATDVELPPGVNDAIVDAEVIALLRRSVTNGDAFTFGYGELPALLQEQLRAAGVTGAAASGALLMMYAGLAGMLGESNVKVSKTVTTQRVGELQTGFTHKFESVPNPNERADGAQIRIDEIRDGGQVRYEVYIAGTADFNPISDSQPNDMTSNVAGVAGQSPASYRAVVEAMQLAGIDSGSPVTFTGYSQGGLIASMLASSGDYNTHGLVTFGAPAGQVVVPGGFPAVIIEHEEDLVPALGGVQTNTEALLVTRQAFSPEHPADMSLPVPGHQPQYYTETTELMDQAESAELTAAAAELDAFSTGDSVSTTFYRADRVG